MGQIDALNNSLDISRGFYTFSQQTYWKVEAIIKTFLFYFTSILSSRISYPTEEPRNLFN